MGDGDTYGGSKNYRLCSKESYIVHLVLMDPAQDGTLAMMRSAVQTGVLQSIKTQAVSLGDAPKNYTLPSLFFAVVLLSLVLFAFRNR